MAVGSSETVECDTDEDVTLLEDTVVVVNILPPLEDALVVVDVTMLLEEECLGDCVVEGNSVDTVETSIAAKC